MDHRLQSLKCFVEQEQHIPQGDFLHKIQLFVLYKDFFVVLFRKVTHGDELLAIRLPYLSTCNQMKTLYYEVVEPSAHDASKDGRVFWAGIKETDIPIWGAETEQRVQKVSQESWMPGPVEMWQTKVMREDGTENS